MSIPPNAIAISQMTTLEIVMENALLPIVFGSSNYSTTAGAIADLVTLERLGIPLVENIAPTDMPISVLQQEALDLKLDRTGSIAIPQVIDLEQVLSDLSTMDITLDRITGIDERIQDVIDSQPVSSTLVMQGDHQW